MRGMKGYGPPLIPRDVRGRELISTGDLRAVFPGPNRVTLGRVLERARVSPDPVVRGERGERYWPRADAVGAVQAWEARKGVS